jgi:hypothetical protein
MNCMSDASRAATTCSRRRWLATSASTLKSPPREITSGEKREKIHFYT